MKKFLSFLLTTIFLNIISGGETFAQQKKRNNQDNNLKGKNSREAEYLFIEGEKYFILDELVKAKAYFNRALEINPDNATIHYKIGQVLLKSDIDSDLEKALISSQNAIKLDRKNKYFYLLSIEILSKQNKYDKVAKTIELMISEAPNAENYLYELATVYSKTNKYTESIEAYNKAEKYFGVNPISSSEKQKIYIEIGKQKEAILEAEKLLLAFPKEEQYLLNLAQVLIDFAQPIKAIEWIDKYLNVNPNWYKSKIVLSNLYRTNGRLEEYQQLLVQIFDDLSVDIQLKIDVLQGYVTQFEGNIQPKDVAFPLVLVKKLINNYPNIAVVHIVCGDFYFTLDYMKEAQTEYLKAIELKASKYSIWRNLLIIEKGTEDLDNMIAHSDIGLEFHPNQPLLYYFNGYGYFGKGNYNQAIQSLETAIKISVSNPQFESDANCLLGQSYFEIDNFEKSDLAFEESIRLNPINDYALYKYSYYLSLRKEKLLKAEKMSRLAIKYQPANARYLDSHSWILFKQGKYLDAKIYSEVALRQANPLSIFYEHYGDILFMLDDLDNALIQWKKARTLPHFSELLDEKITNQRIN